MISKINRNKKLAFDRKTEIKSTRIMVPKRRLPQNARRSSFPSSRKMRFVNAEDTKMQRGTERMMYRVVTSFGDDKHDWIRLIAQLR